MLIQGSTGRRGIRKYNTCQNSTKSRICTVKKRVGARRLLIPNHGKRTHGERRERNEGNLSSLCTPSLQTLPRCPIQKMNCAQYMQKQFLSSDLDCDPLLHRSPVSRSKFAGNLAGHRGLLSFLRSIWAVRNRIVITVGYQATRLGS